jgi:hypothetical protein
LSKRKYRPRLNGAGRGGAGQVLRAVFPVESRDEEQWCVSLRSIVIPSLPPSLRALRAGAGRGGRYDVHCAVLERPPARWPAAAPLRALLGLRAPA